MKHLIISREYPPAPGGGIGTYVYNISRLLAEAGETVHVIGQKWEGAEKDIDEQISGRLIIHRIPIHDWTFNSGQKIHPDIMNSNISAGLYNSGYFPQCFSYNASLLSEKLISEEGIDIIEAQEFEAPLYYLQIRRSLGLGPKINTPCLVHLHTPTEITAKYNDWDVNDPYFIFATKFETYTINAADALISPSMFLANHIKETHGVMDVNIKIIPYPLGNDIEYVTRDKSVWQNGRITYIGRLERRKGVIEYVDTAVSISKEFPEIKFDFIGGDVIEPDSTSVQEVLLERIPDSLKSRFIFHGHMNRTEVNNFLRESKICVVPSRFENYPNTCIEAMCTGLPIVSSPYGGMADMLQNDLSGWISNDLSIESLADTLKRAFRASPDTVEKMGFNASQRINSICDNQKIVNSHLEYKNNILQNNNKISFSIPSNILWKPGNLIPNSKYDTDGSRTGIAFILTGYKNGNQILDTLKNIKEQKKMPSEIIVTISDEITKSEITKNSDSSFNSNVHILDISSYNFRAAFNTVCEYITKLNPIPLGISFLENDVYLDENYLDIMDSILKKHRNLGVVSSWASVDGNKNKLVLNSSIMMPYQLLHNEIMPYSVIRTEALINNKYINSSSKSDLGYCELFDSILLDGWLAITVPVIMSDVGTKHLKYNLSKNNILGDYIIKFITDLNDNYRIQLMRELVMFLGSFNRLNYIIDDLKLGKNWYEKLSHDRQVWIDSLVEQLNKANEQLNKANRYNILNIYKRSLLRLKRVFSFR